MIMLDPECGRLSVLRQSAYRSGMRSPGGMQRGWSPVGWGPCRRQDLEAQPRSSDLLRPVCGATGGKGAETTPPTRGWIRGCGVYTQPEYYAATKKKETLPLWPHGRPRGHHTKEATPEKRAYDATHIRNINKGQKGDSLQNGNRLTDTESKLTVTNGEKEGGTSQEFGTN